MKKLQSKKCFLCNTILDKKNDSKEHLIKNSIGGRKTVKGFICKSCNNKTGHEWDDEIDKLLGNYCSLLFQISRENGQVQPQKIINKNNGENYFLKYNGFTKIAPEYSYDKLNGIITLKGFSKERVKQFEKQLQKEGKIPKNTENHIFEERIEQEEISTSIEFNIPPLNSNFSKSIVKSALALLSSQNNSLLKFCILSKDFLTNPSLKPSLHYVYEIDPILNRPFATPLHCIHIYSQEQNINAYVELFGIARYSINLSNTYIGEDIIFTYAINPINGEQLNLSFSFNQNSNQQENHPAKIMKNLLEEVTFKTEIERIFQESINFAIDKKNYKNGEKLGKDIMQYFINNSIPKAKDRPSYINFLTTQFKIMIENFYKTIFKK